MQPRTVRQVRLRENGHTVLVLEDRQHPSWWAVFFDRLGIPAGRYLPGFPLCEPPAYSRRDRDWQPA